MSVKEHAHKISKINSNIENTDTVTDSDKHESIHYVKLTQMKIQMKKMDSLPAQG